MSLPPKPPHREGHPSTFRPVTGLFKPDLDPWIVALDANMLVMLAVGLLGDRSPALLELHRAGYVKLVISADDVAAVALNPDATGKPRHLPRVVRSLRRAKPKDADVLEALWWAHVAPNVTVIHPGRLPDTPRSVAVRQRDPDDAMLARVAELVGADYFFSSDIEAFGDGSWPIMVSGNRTQRHTAWVGLGEITAALRNHYRTEEKTQSLLIPFTVTGRLAFEGSKALAARLSLRHEVVALGLVSVAALLGWKLPAVRASLWKGLQDYGNLVQQVQLTPQEIAYHQELLKPYQMTWEEPRDVVTWAARKLARAPHGLTTTELAAKSRHSIADWRAWLSAYPGIFSQPKQGRWTLVPEGIRPD